MRRLKIIYTYYISCAIIRLNNVAGKRWVGWSNDSIGNKLDLVFEFNGFRMFREVKIHTSHIPTRDVKVRGISKHSADVHLDVMSGTYASCTDHAVSKIKLIT